MPTEKSTFRNSVIVLLGGQISRVLVQAAYFVLLARILGVSSYGAFTAALALIALTSPFSALGTNILMVKNVSRNSESAASNFFRASFYTVIGGCMVTLLLMLLGPLFLPAEISVLALVSISLADLVGMKLIETSGSVWQALGNSKPVAVLPTIINVIRLAGIATVGFVWVEVSVNTWSLIYALITLPFGIGLTVVTVMRLGGLSPMVKIAPKDLRDGLVFSVGIASQNTYNDLDKTMLAKMVSSTSAGVYSAAYRVVDMAYAPVRAVAAAAYPLFFREGEAGIRSAMKLTRRIAPMVLGFGVLGCVAAWVLAPYAPLILGSDYTEAVSVIRLLGPLIIIRGVGFLAADTLMGSGFQSFRTCVQILIALINAALNIWLIPIHGISGAIWSSLICEAVLAILLWGRIVALLRGTKLGRTLGPQTMPDAQR